jgi:ATP-dependent Lon protease
LRSRAEEYGINLDTLNNNEIHVHVPAGAVPKDGPSAGIAMATSILSALLGQAPNPKTAMTGEITLHGKVLAIGGLKEKILAALREGMETIIVPEKNRSTFMALPVSIKKRCNVVFAKDYIDVFDVMFKDSVKSDRRLKRVRPVGAAGRNLAS